MDASIAIIGAGQAGLSAAYEARRAGLEPVVLEASDRPVGSWPHHYDSLTLFSPARYSSLPGLAFGGDPDRYPTRDEVVDYLERYAAWLDVDIRYDSRVERVQETGSGLLGVESAAEEIEAPAVICATGGFGTPFRPALAGLASFTGQVLHSSDYKRPEGFAGRRVLVVGAGNSAVQIAVELAEVADVTLATRKPISWVPQRWLGRDIHWWFDATRFDIAPLSRWLPRLKVAVLDDGRHRTAVGRGQPRHSGMFRRLDGDHVVWEDGTREPVDAVILATGFLPDLSYLAGTRALAPDGTPLHRGGVSRTVPGLGYVGLPFQRSFASATIRGAARDARHVIRAGSRAVRRPMALA